MTTTTAIDRLRGMVDGERLRQSAVDDLAELAPDDIRAIAEALNDLADQIDEAVDAVETWADEEDREDRAMARDEALEAIERVCDSVESDLSALDRPDWLRTAIAEDES